MLVICLFGLRSSLCPSPVLLCVASAPWKLHFPGSLVHWLPVRFSQWEEPTGNRAGVTAPLCGSSFHWEMFPSPGVLFYQGVGSWVLMTPSLPFVPLALKVITYFWSLTCISVPFSALPKPVTRSLLKFPWLNYLAWVLFSGLPWSWCWVQVPQPGTWPLWTPRTGKTHEWL